MNPADDKPLWRPKWNVLTIYVVLVGVALVIVFLVLLTHIFDTSNAGEIPQVVWLLATFVLLIALILMLSKILKILDGLQENNAKLERIIAILEKNGSTLVQLEKGVQVSDMAKRIVFRDADRQFLREAVLNKFQQQDFEAAHEIIDGIAQSSAYAAFAEQLREEGGKHRDTTDREQIGKVAAQVEKLFEGYRWAEAGTEIENLIRKYPNSEEAKALRQKLLTKKEERKKVLLAAWNDAVQRKATDRSLEILRELDQYLTPNEGLALQEAAKDVFKTKLHNLGVQFSFALSGKNWARALEIGRQITRDFPNSKMAEEIRERLDFLREKAEQQPG